MNGRKILVVDDERRIADTLVLILQARGYEAQAAYDGQQGLETWRVSHPDLVISDVLMPGLNGIQMVMAMRAEQPEVRALLCSGQAATAEMLQEALEQGHEFELLAKPVHPEILLAKIAEMLKQPSGREASGARAPQRAG